MAIVSTTYTTGSGTFTVPADINSSSIDIEIWGAGGNGGSPANDTAQAGGAGGGGGGYCKKTVTVSPGDSIAYSIGSNTTCSTYSMTANNGTNASGYTTAGTGGTASGGDINTTGGNGSLGAAAVGTANAGGNGGNAAAGGTGGTGGTGSNGGNGVCGGGGGGGSYSEVISGVTYPAGTGGSGQIKFTYSAPVEYTEYPSGGLSIGGHSPEDWIEYPSGGLEIGGNAALSAELIPTANHSYSSGTVTYYTPAYTVGGDYSNLSDSSDNSYMQFTGANAYACWPLTDMPADFGSVSSVTITIKGSRGSKGDYASLDYVQILKSDNSTAITNTATAILTGTATTFNIVPSTINYTDKTSWDGALLKIKQDYGTGTGITIYEAKVTITYTPGIDFVASGGLIIGGSATFANSFAPSGGLTIGGTAPESKGWSPEIVGGLTIGGETWVEPYIPTGGIKIGGVNSQDYNNRSDGGLSIGGSADVTWDRVWIATGGLKIGGIANTEVNGEHQVEGGLVIGGGEDYGAEYFEYPDGGLVIGGDVPDELSYTGTGEGIGIGGSADITFDFVHVPEGGLIISDAPFANGYKYRNKIVIPAGTVTTDIEKFFLLISETVTGASNEADFWAEDPLENPLDIDVRFYDSESGEVNATIKTPVSASSDTEIYLYYGRD